MADFKIPSQPTNLFPMPFADEGAKAIIPDATTLHGRATIPGGFPNETQLPLTQGGVAPNRLDFQGILYMLSAFAFWQQSGGLFNYNASLNYTPPAIVFHNNMLWWNVAPCGPATDAGDIEPGTDESHWMEFLRYLAKTSDGSGAVIGEIKIFPVTVAPEGYFICDGSPFDPVRYPKLFAFLGRDTVPDLRGLFLRGYDPSGERDPDGSTRGILSIQQDAAQRIAGSVELPAGTDASGDGSFNLPSGSVRYYAGTGATRLRWGTLTFDSALSSRAANETRGKNASVLYVIKHD